MLQAQYTEREDSPFFLYLSVSSIYYRVTISFYARYHTRKKLRYQYQTSSSNKNFNCLKTTTTALKLLFCPGSQALPTGPSRRAVVVSIISVKFSGMITVRKIWTALRKRPFIATFSTTYLNTDLPGIEPELSRWDTND